MDCSVDAWYFDEFFSGYQVVVKISRRMCLIYIFSVLIGRDERQDTYIVVIENCLVVNIWKIFSVSMAVVCTFCAFIGENGT
jgi:hypothetical protein